MPHSIRLRHPWQAASIGSLHWIFERKFHRPSGLQPNQPLRLSLQLQPDVRLTECLLNEVTCDAFFARPGEGVIEITHAVQAFNRLSLSLKRCSPDVSESDNAAPPGKATPVTLPSLAELAEVQLEID